jgi:hypothetical protein
VLAQSTLLPKSTSPRNVAFHYAAKSSQEDLEFLSKFDIVVTGAILPNDQVRPLRSRNARLVVYQWSSAQYPDAGNPSDRAWESELKRNARSWLISPDPVPGGAAAPGRSALWYDFADSNLIAALSAHIRSLLEQNAYQGVFLDTLGFYSLPEKLQREFRRRHPSLDYDRCQGAFLSHLRRAIEPHGIIFTNQGYRRPEHFLQYSDLDLIENSCTYIKPDGSTGFRRWYSPKAEWDSIEVPMTKLVVSAARLYPRTQFVHINYATGAKSISDRVVSYSFACAKLWNHLSFVTSPDVQKAIHSDIYFGDLGQPLTPSYEEDRAAGVAWRRFQNGVVAVNTSDEPYRISSLKLALSDPPRGYVLLNK